MRERGSLRHGGHGDGDGHPRADDGAEGEASDDPCPGDDFSTDEGAYDGREHAAFGEEHAAAGGVGVRHHFEREDEEDGGDEVSGLHEVGGEAHFATALPSVVVAFVSGFLRNIFSIRSVMPNPPTTLTVAVVTATKPRMCAGSG